MTCGLVRLPQVNHDGTLSAEYCRVEMQFTAKLYCFLLLCAAVAAAPVPTEGSDEPDCPNDRDVIEERACP
ncbi:hypothetical protein EV421DRAFT_1812623 [Armillaria borealis]|uniref:Uncharacterized protein n=1 Tax=Armillaria borealis TaxID=47425 RepID=A0AA39JF88_9AGAR|nr:hypothetical protein EV421DRAFT_1812623 [Armillaria borealis]